MIIIVLSVETGALSNVIFRSGECVVLNCCDTIVFLVVLCSVPGAAPQPVEGRNTSPTSILVTWGEVPADKQHGIILEYSVIYKKSVVDTETKERVVTPSIQFNSRRIELTKLTEYTSYSIQVLAATVKGDGPRSEPITVRTDQDSKYKEKSIKFLG